MTDLARASCQAILALVFSVWLVATAESVADNCWPGFIESGQFDEQVREVRFSCVVRAILIAPQTTHFHDDRPTQLVIYSTPNGNTAEQTLGCRLAEEMDWHFDIQHVAAQVRMWRASHPAANVVLACVQPNNRSWPTWRQTYENGNTLIREMISALAGQIPADDLRLVLTGHSGGGSFLNGFVESVEKIPADVRRIAYLDANYSTTPEHAQKFLRWLEESAQNRLLFLAYDDREIRLNGKRVVGPTGGTYRASHRLLDFLRDQVALTEETLREFSAYKALGGRLQFLIHGNPENKILHTRLVGEMNGLEYALEMGGKEAESLLSPPRRYGDFVQSNPYEPQDWAPPGPAIPRRPQDAPTGSEFVAQWSEVSPAKREAAILGELLRGNVPTFWRGFSEVKIQGTDDDGVQHELIVGVSPDYLAIGTDDDFCRMPMTPETAQKVADAYGCLLPTRKLVDAIYEQAQIKLAPQPLTEEREELSTFSHHQQIVQRQFAEMGGSLGMLTSGLKKDVVITNELAKRPGHVAIYGWHQQDGRPIQPLTTVHIDAYVDYSHGVRLVSAFLSVDGRTVRASEVLSDESLHPLLSDEGPLPVPYYEPERKS